MKTRERVILVALVLVLVAALVAQAIMSGADDQSRASIQKGNNRDYDAAFFQGAMFAQSVITREMARRASGCDQKDILAGLEGVQVVVEGVNPKVGKYGLTEQLLQTDTELRLRQHGIRIFTDEEAANRKVEQPKKSHETLYRSVEESLAQPNCYFQDALRDLIRDGLMEPSARPPFLYINVNAVVSEEIGLATFSIDVKLQEAASVRRNGAFSLAAIWKEGSVHACSSSRLREYARENLRDRLDEFINAYLAANPKDRSSPNER